MSVTYSENADLKTIELRIDGPVTGEDFETLLPKMQAFIETHEKIRLIEIIDSLELPGFETLGMIWEGIKFDIYAIPRISHCAVVSDIGWMSPWSKAAGAMVSTKLRTFSMDQLDEARDWASSAE